MREVIDFDRLVESLYIAESEATEERLLGARAEARLLLSGINRFHGDEQKQTSYMLAILLFFDNNIPPELATLAAVEYAENPQHALH